MKWLKQQLSKYYYCRGVIPFPYFKHTHFFAVELINYVRENDKKQQKQQKQQKFVNIIR